MGVKGLLGLLKSIQKQTSLKSYAGQTLGVDAFGWLHRGATGCAYQLAADKPTTFYITFVLNRVRMLLDFGITPYLVFDGDAVPSKKDTNSKRREEREAAKELGLMLFRSGKKDQAQQELQKAVSITPQMTYNLIEELRRMNVQVLVAPYEADAQLVYLEKIGVIDGIISEDSDLLVFGAQRLITKLDQHGSCAEIRRTDLVLNKTVSFAGWSDSMFRRMAILSGCDYLKNINGVGLKTAHDFVKRHKEVTKIIRMMALHGKYTVPPDYQASFEAAEQAFLYHRVFCPKAGQLVFLNTIPPDLKVEDMPFLGPHVEAELAVGVACGDLNPKTKQPFRSVSDSITPRPAQPYRRQTHNSSAAIEPKRSVDNFFRPYRTPLAELDPNSLTPSPSQQRLLERNSNASWEPRVVNSAPPLRRTQTDGPRMSAASSTVQSNKSIFLSKAAAVSTYKSVKRQRLCSESDEISPSKEIKQSRFFSHSSIEQSPLTTKKTRERRLRKSAFDVFSDESVEGIMLGMDEETTVPSVQDIRYPELPSLVGTEASDDADFVPQSSPVKAQALAMDSQSSHGTTAFAEMSFGSGCQDQTAVQTATKDSGGVDAFEDLLSYHITSSHESTKAKGLHRTFSTQSPELQSAALKSLKPVRVESVGDDTEPHAEDIASPQRAASVKFRSLAKTFACRSPELQTRALQSLGKTPAISNLKYVTDKIPIEGSEDALPMSSDVEVEEAEDRPRRKLDFKSFRYMA